MTKSYILNNKQVLSLSSTPLDPILRRHNAASCVIYTYHNQLTVYLHAVDQGCSSNVNKPNMAALIDHQNKYYLNKPNDLKIKVAAIWNNYHKLVDTDHPTYLYVREMKSTHHGLAQGRKKKIRWGVVITVGILGGMVHLMSSRVVLQS